jgi:phosphoenolpyruvate carboxykinase (ATP)
LPLHPSIYAKLLGEKIFKHQVKVWLINTGWTGGPYGVGERIHLPYTRAMVRAALTNGLDDIEYRLDPHFGFSVPQSVPGVPPSVLDPRQTWSDALGYDQQASLLVSKFQENFEEYAGQVSSAVKQAGPQKV